MGMDITCGSCGRSWTRRTGVSVYLQLDLAYQPCPYCEAYTLKGIEAASRVAPEETRPKRRALKTPDFLRSR